MRKSIMLTLLLVIAVVFGSETFNASTVTYKTIKNYQDVAGLTYKIKYIDGVKDSAIATTSYGQITIRRTFYSNGHLKTEKKYYDYGGLKVSTTYFSNGYKNERTYYRNDGTRYKKIYYNNNRVSTSFEYRNDGKTKLYKREYNVSEQYLQYKYYYNPSGQLVKIREYAYGTPVTTAKYVDGKLTSIESFTYEFEIYKLTDVAPLTVVYSDYEGTPIVKQTFDKAGNGTCEFYTDDHASCKYYTRSYYDYFKYIINQFKNLAV